MPESKQTVVVDRERLRRIATYLRRICVMDSDVDHDAAFLRHLASAPPEPDQPITQKAAAERLGVHVNTIATMLDDGRLEAIEIGNDGGPQRPTRRVTESSVRRLEAQGQSAPPEVSGEGSGWVVCPACNGTGKRPPEPPVLGGEGESWTIWACPESDCGEFDTQTWTNARASQGCAYANHPEAVRVEVMPVSEHRETVERLRESAQIALEDQASKRTQAEKRANDLQALPEKVEGKQGSALKLAAAFEAVWGKQRRRADEAEAALGEVEAERDCFRDDRDDECEMREAVEGKLRRAEAALDGAAAEFDRRIEHHAKERKRTEAAGEFVSGERHYAAVGAYAGCLKILRKKQAALKGEER